MTKRMEILRHLPSKDWPVGSILIDRDTVYVKGEENWFLIIKRDLVRPAHDDDLNGEHTYDESCWWYDYVPYAFFN